MQSQVTWESSLRSRLQQIVRGKLQCCFQLPLRLMGGFAEYVGRPMHEAKECIASCVKEFEAIADDHLKHPVAQRLLGKATQVSLQLYERLSQPMSSSSE